MTTGTRTMRRNEHATCTTCPYFAFISEQRIIGVCKARPPALFHGTQGRAEDLVVWPRVFGSDWCGAHPRFFDDKKEDGKP